MPQWVSALLAMGVGLTVGVVGGKYFIYRNGAQIGNAITINNTHVNYSVNNIVKSGNAKLWGLSPFKRGDEIDDLLGNNVGHNFPTYDKFDPLTGEAVSVKSLNTVSKTYQTQAGLYNRLKGYVDSLGNFKGGWTASKRWIAPRDIKSQTLEIAIPDRPLTPAQIAALDQLKKDFGGTVKIVITVVR